jgi:8-amino-7-oxononanoate synthase
VLAGAGTIFVDAATRRTLRDACAIAGLQGATVRTFDHGDPAHLESLLRAPNARPHVVCLDGVNNMTGNAPDIAGFARIARAHNALLYVDDSHGFGVVGERSEDELCDYGCYGNGVVRHVGESYDNIVLVAGFSKAYSSTLAYVACPRVLKRVLKAAAQPYLSSGQSPVASLATVIEGLKLNERKGDELRLAMYRMTNRVLDAIRSLGIETPNVSGYPIIEVPLANPGDIHAVGSYLYAHGIYVTTVAPPFVPEGQGSFRIQISAANTWDQIEHLVKILGDVSDRFRLQAAAA